MIPYFDSKKMIFTQSSIPRESRLNDLVFPTTTAEDLDAIAIKRMLDKYSKGYEAEIYDAWTHRRIAEYDEAMKPIYFTPSISSNFGVDSESKTILIPRLSGKENDARNFLTTVLYDMFKIRGGPSEEVYFFANNKFFVNKVFGYENAVYWPHVWKGNYIEYIDPNPIGVIATLDRALDIHGIPGFQDRIAKYMLLQLWYEANMTRGKVSQGSHDWTRKILLSRPGAVLFSKPTPFGIHPHTWKIDMGQILGLKK